MNSLIKQLSLFISFIALIALGVGIYGLYDSWSITKSLNIIISGITGLVISLSFALTIEKSSSISKLIQMGLSAMLILSATGLTLDSFFYFALSFVALWISTTFISEPKHTKWSIFLFLALIASTGTGLILNINPLIYMSIAILLIASTLRVVVNLFDQSK